MKKYFILVFVFAFSGMLSAKSTQDWYKIPPEDFQQFIADFPEPGSKSYQQDFEILLELQAHRNEEECKFGRYLKWPNFAPFFAKDKPGFLDDSQLPISFDVLLTKEEVDHYKKLMNRVLSYSSKVTKYYKEKYQRERPSRVNPEIEPCAEVPGGKKSYPSSHTAKGALVGCLLAAKFEAQGDKKRAEQILQYGEYMGELRAVVGVHHPSDVAAGKSIGYAICDRLLSEKSFAKEFEAL